MAIRIKAYNIFETGKYRKNQEDCIFPTNCNGDTTERVFILCDGMGGHECGEVASKVVCGTMSECVIDNLEAEKRAEEVIANGVNKALDILDQKDKGEVKKMGTTMVMLWLHDNAATVAHIGDSRLYQIRPEEGNAAATQIAYKTSDHSLVNDLVRLGEMTEEEARTSGQKNILTRAIMAKMDHRPKADVVRLTDIRKGDYFFICSDGMLDQIEDSNLKFIFSQAGVSDQQKVETLKGASLESRDNHSAHIIHIL